MLLARPAAKRITTTGWISVLGMLSFVSAASKLPIRAPSEYDARLVREAYVMGTVVSLEVYTADRKLGLNQLEEFLRIFERTEAELSSWKEDSLISRFNRSPVGQPFALDGSICRLFGELEDLHQLSAQTFDPAIGRLLDAWGVRRTKRLPVREELDTARARSGFQYITLLHDQCAVEKSEAVWLDSGAFGKGAALEKVSEYSQNNSTAPWLINIGGQIAVHGSPGEDSCWEVGIASPKDRSKALLTVRLASGSLASSGNQLRREEVDGVEIGHIIDPRTGWPSCFSGSVTVWHEDALAADALSTALHVMGPEKGLAWANQHQVAVCFVRVSEAGRIEILRNQFFLRQLSQ